MSTSRFEPRERRARRMRVIAVTGRGGKTTTTWVTASVLAEAGLQVGVVSDLGCVDADGTLAGPFDRRRPDAIAAWIERLSSDGCTYAVVEVPLDMLEAGALARGSCDAIVVTGLAGASPAARRSRVRRVVSGLASGGCLVTAHGRGDKDLLEAAARRGELSCLTAGLDEACDVSARPVERGLHGQTILASAGGMVVPVSIDAPVASYVRNAMCAAAVGQAFGVRLDVAARGIEAAGNVAGRVERLDRGQDFAAFLDTPPGGHALASTLASLRRLTAGRLAVVAEQGFVDALGSAAFAGPVRRRCDDVVVVPSGVLDDDADEVALAAYARIDRLLGRLGANDCLLVLGGTVAGQGPRRSAGVPLATLVEGWMRLAHPPQCPGGGTRRAA